MTRSRSQERAAGEIRNIQVLGCRSDVKSQDKDLYVTIHYLLIAYQGQGGVRAFVGTEHSLELKEVTDSSKLGKYQKYGGGRNFRYAEYEVPTLPTTIVVVGSTEADGMVRKPAREAHVKAQISQSGHVTKSHHQLMS